METFVNSLTLWTPISRRAWLRSWTALLQKCLRNWKTSEHAMPSKLTMRKPFIFPCIYCCGLKNFSTASIEATFWCKQKDVSSLTVASWELSQSLWSMTLSSLTVTQTACYWYCTQLFIHFPQSSILFELKVSYWLTCCASVAQANLSNICCWICNYHHANEIQLNPHCCMNPDLHKMFHLSHL